MSVTLVCTVRGCGEPLTREERSVSCPRRHSFDVARAGYINLLQPQDRRSRYPGDSKDAVRARRRFLERGFAAPLVARIGGAGKTIHGPILDVGCGEGHHLAALRQASGSEGHGVDISVFAIELAARKRTDCLFVVANADRFLPYADASFSLVTSITSRMHPAEFRRVLRPDGQLLIAVAGQDDLIELREAVLGERKMVDRAEAAVIAFESHFRLARQDSVRVVVPLDAEAIEDVMTSSYRAMRTRERGRLAALDGMDVTLSRDLLFFEKRVTSDK